MRPAGRRRPPPPGPHCHVCLGPLDRTLHAREPHTTHPTCDPTAAAARARWAAERDRQTARERNRP